MICLFFQGDIAFKDDKNNARFPPPSSPSKGGNVIFKAHRASCTLALVQSKSKSMVRYSSNQTQSASNATILPNQLIETKLLFTLPIIS